MNMRKIKRIDIVTREGAKSYSVGQVVNGLKIATIKDSSWEHENGVDFIYQCLDKDGTQVVYIANCPHVVEYEEE
jgi:hypothetical protein